MHTGQEANRDHVWGWDCWCLPSVDLFNKQITHWNDNMSGDYKRARMSDLRRSSDRAESSARPEEDGDGQN